MSKETAEHFIKNVVKTYQEARELAFPDIHNKVERGRNHTVASKIEDLLAITIQTKLNRHHTFKVDQPLSIEGKTFTLILLLLERVRLFTYWILKWILVGIEMALQIFVKRLMREI